MCVRKTLSLLICHLLFLAGSDGSLSISDLCSVLLGCGNGGNTSHEDISCIILQKLSSLASSCNKVFEKCLLRSLCFQGNALHLIFPRVNLNLLRFRFFRLFY